MADYKKIKKVGLWLGIIAILMFFFGFALVPLYDVLCKALGINGKTSNEKQINSTVVDKTRTISMHFVSTRNANLKWDFYPMIKKLEIHPGQNVKVTYYAKNNTNQTMTVQAIPSVTPGLAASHLKKTECFCFQQQTLKAGESQEMPLIFHIDNDLPKNIHDVTLSYTLFAAK